MVDLAPKMGRMGRMERNDEGCMRNEDGKEEGGRKEDSPVFNGLFPLAYSTLCITL